MSKKLKVIVSVVNSRWLKNSEFWNNIKEYVSEKRLNTVVGGITVRTGTVFYIEMDTSKDFIELVRIITNDSDRRIELRFNYYEDNVYMEIGHY